MEYVKIGNPCAGLMCTKESFASVFEGGNVVLIRPLATTLRTPRDGADVWTVRGHLIELEGEAVNSLSLNYNLIIRDNTSLFSFLFGIALLRTNVPVGGDFRMWGQ